MLFFHANALYASNPNSLPGAYNAPQVQQNLISLFFLSWQIFTSLKFESSKIQQITRLSTGLWIQFFLSDVCWRWSKFFNAFQLFIVNYLINICCNLVKFIAACFLRTSGENFSRISMPWQLFFLSGCALRHSQRGAKMEIAYPLRFNQLWVLMHHCTSFLPHTRLGVFEQRAVFYRVFCKKCPSLSLCINLCL